MPGLGREPNLHPGVRKIASDASVAATKQIVRGCLDFIQRYATVGPRAGMALEALNALIDQQFTADINIFPSYGLSSLSMILKMLSVDEMSDLIKAGEQATWPKIPCIATTTRIGQTLDRILHEFEVDEAHWLRSAPQTDAMLRERSPSSRKPRQNKDPVRRRNNRATGIIQIKAKSPSHH